MHYLLCPSFLPYITPHITPHITSHITPHIPPHVPPHITPHISIRYMTSPLFGGIEEDMNEDEMALSHSTPGYHMDMP